MPREFISEIAARLGKIGCPYCHYAGFSVVLRCDLLSGGTCELVAECQQCSMEFDLGRVETIGELSTRPEQELASRLCSCGVSPRLELLCNVETEDCHFVAACPKCGAQWRIIPGEARTLVA